MKRVLLGATSFLSLAALDQASNATPFDFTYTGSVVTFTVPATDTYHILAFGAQGGSGTFAGFVGAGGQGAEIGGDFRLSAGEPLQIAVGGTATLFNGGGGGSFVVGPGNTPLVIAGGGGGGAAFQGGPLPGQGGLTGPDGGGFGGGSGGNGGAGGSPGGGGGGGGFFSGGGAGQNLSFGAAGTGGGPFPDLAGGIFGGGFGGGGGEDGGAGGGGGYSGGAGGTSALGGSTPGGGGGSFDAGTDQILLADLRTGNGEVIITELAAAVPEPASIALLGAGLLSLAAALRRRQAKRNPRPGRQ